VFFFFFSSRRRHTRSLCDWSSDVCSSDLGYSIQSRAATGKTSWRSSSRTAGSEERRVGKECRSRWSPYHYKKKTKAEHRVRQRREPKNGGLLRGERDVAV